MSDESPRIVPRHVRRKSLFPSRRLVDNELEATSPPLARRKSFFHRLPADREDSEQKPTSDLQTVHYAPSFPVARRKSYYHRKPYEEIGERLMRARASSILPIHQHKEVVNVPLLIDENGPNEGESCTETSGGSELKNKDVRVNFVDLLSMQLSSNVTTDRVVSVLSRRDDTDDFHHVFCELEALKTDDNGVTRWREAARWVKYEESIESSGERWSKPHVSLLSLQSLFEVRRVFLTGILMVDIDAECYEDIIDQILQKLVSEDHLKEVDKKRTRDLLTCRHLHGIPSKGCHLSSCLKKRKSLDGQEVCVHKEVDYKFNSDFLRKLPEGCEAMNILVGESGDFSEPITAFVRLKKTLLLEGMPEVEIPTRYLFVLLGPNDKNDNGEYGEIGRAVATIMSDEVFREIAFYAESRRDFLAGVDEFLSQLSCLPPGKFDPEERIEPPYTPPSQSHRLHLKQSKLNLIEDDADVSLLRTGRLFGGWVADVRRKLPFYGSDLRDALHPQCLASFFFMYIACLTPVITIGGLLGQTTDNYIGAIEALISAAICGVSWHLLAGQPLAIIGATGPVLVFEKILVSICQTFGVKYLAFRFWTGLWISVILMVMVVFDLSFLVRFITRFTEEEFAMLIALIFIIESLKKLQHVMYAYPVDWHPDEPALHDYTCFCIPRNGSDTFEYTSHDMYGNQSLEPWISTHQGAIPIQRVSTQPAHYNETSFLGSAARSISEATCDSLNGSHTGSGCDTPVYVPNAFFYSCVLYVSTFTLCIVLKSIRSSPYFTTRVRSIISDFGVPIAIVTMVMVDIFVDIPTPKLEVPDEVRPTRADRGWIVNPLDNPMWCLPAAILPAMLAAVLLFMDQQITAVIVNRREHKLQKGCGYHLDLSVIAVQIAICSVIGTPWFVAATMESINHVRSLSRESESSAPGERPKFLGVREQRVTGAMTFLFIGLSAFLSVILKFIPMPVLFGVFLFMGVSALRNLQFVERVMIMFMPPKYQPDYTYLRYVSLRRVHLFTFIQILCLAGLWAIKTTVSVLFPVMVLALCFVRKGLDWVFWPEELQWLDDILPEADKKELDDISDLDSVINIDDQDDVELNSLKIQDDNDNRKKMDTIIELNGQLQDSKNAKTPNDITKSDDSYHGNEKSADDA